MIHKKKYHHKSNSHLIRVTKLLVLQSHFVLKAIKNQFKAVINFSIINLAILLPVAKFTKLINFITDTKVIEFSPDS